MQWSSALFGGKDPSTLCTLDKYFYSIQNDTLLDHKAVGSTSSPRYWLNYWHFLISKGTSGFTSNTLLIRIQYCFQQRQQRRFCDGIKFNLVVFRALETQVVMIILLPIYIYYKSNLFIKQCLCGHFIKIYYVLMI